MLDTPWTYRGQRVGSVHSSSALFVRSISVHNPNNPTLGPVSVTCKNVTAVEVRILSRCLQWLCLHAENHPVFSIIIHHALQRGCLCHNNCKWIFKRIQNPFVTVLTFTPIGFTCGMTIIIELISLQTQTTKLPSV